MPIAIRSLSEDDLESANAIIRAAFNNQDSRLTDLRVQLTVQPDGWFMALQDDSPVGVVGATIYQTFAHVGMMAVHPRVQRQGVGLAMMQHLLAWLDGQHVPCVLLDASAAGQGLYEKLGFAAYRRVAVLQRRAESPFHTPAPQVEPISMRDLDELAEFDAAIFGANRGKLLRAILAAFPERAFLLRSATGQIAGHIFAQENRIGPWVAERPQDAEALLQAAAPLRYAGTVSAIVPEENPAAVELLGRYGFEVTRANLHMGRGASPPPRRRDRMYAQTSLALG